MLEILKNDREKIRLRISDTDSLDSITEILNLLFPHTTYNIDVCGNDIVVIVSQ